MFKLLFLVAVAFLFASVVAGQEPRKPLGPEFLRQYGATNGFLLGRPVNFKFAPDNKHLFFLRTDGKSKGLRLYQMDLADGKVEELLNAEKLLGGAQENLTPEEKARRERMRLSASGLSDYHLTPDGAKILLPLSGKLFLFDRAAKATKELKTGKGTLIDPKLNHDGSKVAYVLDFDVYVYDLATDKESRITHGGTVVKTHGLAEFVAQEEMHRMSGYWWSPDGTMLAVEEADQTGVEQWFVADPTHPDKAPLPQYYPRPGKKNVKVRLGLVSLKDGEAGKEPRWLDWSSIPQTGEPPVEYLAAAKWLPGGLYIQLQDRKQQHLWLSRVDTAGVVQRVESEKESRFINLHPEFPMEAGKEILWYAEPAREIKSLGRPGLKLEGFDIAKAISVDPAGEHLILSSIASKDPRSTKLSSVAIKEGRLLPETLAELSGNAGIHSAAFSKDQDWIAWTHTDTNAMPKTTVWHKDQWKYDVPSAAVEPDVALQWSTDRNQGKFHYYILKPANFDPMKKYPVIVDVYGGPTHQTVLRSKRPLLLKQWLADQGYIVVGIDNRGTPGRGPEWARGSYGQFGSVPLDDQIEGLKEAAKQVKQMDLDRVGIVGWSFGGYMSALAVLKRPDVFKAAVAGAPVTDWEDYDTHYTERYMGLLPESQKAYDDANLVKMAGKLERPLLLVHGTADDNVYFRHSLRLADAIFRAGKECDVLPLAGLTHMVPDPVVTEKLWLRTANHFKKHLGDPK